MYNYIVPPTISRNQLLSTAQCARLLATDLEVVTPGPIVHVLVDVWRVTVHTLVDTTEVFDRFIFVAVELHPWDGLAAGGTGREFVCLVVAVEGTGYDCECRNALRSFGIASEKTGEAAAIGLSGAVDAGRVDAVLLLKLGDEVQGEFHIVDVLGVGVALPLLNLRSCLREEALAYNHILWHQVSYIGGEFHAFRIHGNSLEPVRRVRELAELLLIRSRLGSAMEGKNEGQLRLPIVAGGQMQAVSAVAEALFDGYIGLHAFGQSSAASSIDIADREGVDTGNETEQSDCGKC
jgi:hypothetical protein